MGSEGRGEASGKPRGSAGSGSAAAGAPVRWARECRNREGRAVERTRAAGQGVAMEPRRAGTSSNRAPNRRWNVKIGTGGGVGMSKSGGAGTSSAAAAGQSGAGAAQREAAEARAGGKSTREADQKETHRGRKGARGAPSEPLVIKNNNTKKQEKTELNQVPMAVTCKWGI